MYGYSIIIIIILLCSTYSDAAEQAILVEATGEAVLGEVDTPKAVKERARRDAQNKAIEKAVGTFIKSHTLVSNYQLTEDLAYASVRGNIENVEIIKEGWNDKDRDLYRVHIKALVSPLYPEKGEGLSLKLSLSQSKLKEGDEVKIFYQANSDCYVYIFSVAADGSVTLLLPNSKNHDNSITANRGYEFPPSQSSIRLHAQFLPRFTEKSAEERVKVIATKKKEDIVSLGFREGMFQVYDANSTGLISDLVRRLNQLEPSEWAEATAVYIITR